jgi:hypothetical protein
MLKIFFQTDVSETPTGQITNNKGVTDASNTQSTLPSKNVSSSTRPSTTNDKENLPLFDKQYRPSTAAPTVNDHLLVNGTTNNALLASTSIDPSAGNTSGHSSLRTSASGGPPGSNAITNRTNTANEKTRAQTVRLPNTAVRRRETLDPVPSASGSIKKNDSINSNDKTKLVGINAGDR